MRKQKAAAAALERAIEAATAAEQAAFELASREQLMSQLAAMTPGFTGADIANLCNEAALLAVTNNATTVGLKHFSDALDRLRGGLERSRVMAPAERHRTAVHEAGHAVAAWFSVHASPPLKVSASVSLPGTSHRIRCIVNH